ncbi:hypothetical protein ES703_24584 [subsurface metagenome]
MLVSTVSGRKDFISGVVSIIYTSPAVGPGITVGVCIIPKALSPHPLAGIKITMP